jgi:DNA polymerase-3 subunit gamma/tau
MAGKVLTLKYRPQTFDDVWIQTHVRDTLKRAIARNRLANAYLFSGPRGVGKTTTARILAKCLNCDEGPTARPCNKCPQCVEITASRSLDVIEIDGASNRGVDQIRDLRENIKYAPSTGRYKLYIIDEVHMLTREAFNALLKTLEEPPAHAKFIFATTAPHDVPATIVSRCQRFDFRMATVGEIKDRLTWLTAQEKIGASDAALMAIARRAGGALRDAEGILDQLAAYKPEGIELRDVEELLGLVPAELFADYTDLLLSGDARGLIGFLSRVFESGYDHLEFYAGLVQHFRALLLLEVGGDDLGLSLLPGEAQRFNAQARAFGRDRLLVALGTLAGYEALAKSTQHPRVLLEVMSLELACPRPPAASAESQDNAPLVSDKPSTLMALWAALRLKTNEHKPMLAAFLDLATPASCDEDRMTVSVPAKHKAAAAALEENRLALSSLLTEAAGRRMELVVHLSRKAPPDPLRLKITEILGDVDEQERP